MIPDYLYVGRGSKGQETAAEDNLGGKTNIIIDENTKQTIKGILGSFALIDPDQWWVKGLLEPSGVIHYTGKQPDDYIPIGRGER